jgi:hypothetical protein
LDGRTLSIAITDNELLDYPNTNDVLLGPDSTLEPDSASAGAVNPESELQAWEG